MGDICLIKRPLVWILGAYLIGMYLAWQGLSLPLIMLFILSYCLVIYLFLFKIKNRLLNRRDKFLWSLPVLLILGMMSMKGQLAKPELYKMFEEKIPCELTGQISMIVKKQWGKALYVNNNTISIQDGNQYMCETVIVFCYDDVLESNYLVGNQITIRGTLRKFSKATNPGQFNEELYYQIENIDFKLEADSIKLADAGYSKLNYVLGRMKSRLIRVYETMLSEKESGALIAMLLGEKYLLGDEVKQLYQENGISHVLAISGLHISLIGMFIFQLLKKLKLPIIAATFGSIFFIYCYGIMTNFSVSTNRAIIMMVVMLLSALIGKTYDMLSATALSALIILMQNPLQILSAGFLLSYGAILGIAVILPCLKKLFPSKNALVNSLFISLSAQAATTPFVIYFYYQFPIYSILTNLIILPFVTILMLTSILAGIVGAICLPLGIFLIGGTNYILKFYEWICRIGSNVPGNLITVGRPDAIRLYLYAALLLLFLWLVKRFGRKYSVLLLAAAFVILLIPLRGIGLEITMLDVGQGEAIYMETGSGTTFLIDGGSTDIKKLGTYRLRPFLLSQGTDCIDYAIMTHSDNDHISGLTELIENELIEVRNLMMPDISNKDEAYLKLEALAAEKHIPLIYIKTGDVIKDGAVRMICLHPASGYVAPSSNSYSTVLSITYGDFDLLLTGDLEQEGEQSVVNLLNDMEYWSEYEARPVTDYDVLKVAHHGSGYSTGIEFLRLVKPEYSIISCGKDNKRVTRLIQFRFPCSDM
jgi:competence protein ComEC